MAFNVVVITADAFVGVAVIVDIAVAVVDAAAAVHVVIAASRRFEVVLGQQPTSSQRLKSNFHLLKRQVTFTTKLKKIHLG